MKKYFVCSDTHSFYTPLKEALDNAGFNPENKNHYLIICGDIFDRGDETLELWNFLKKIKRKILIRGNHEILLLNCLKNGYLSYIDNYNGTTKTIFHLAGFNLQNMPTSEVTIEEIFRKARDTGIEKWIEDNYIYFFETKNYVFVHAWVPKNYRKEIWKDIWNRASWSNVPNEILKARNNKNFSKEFLHNKKLVLGHFGTERIREILQEDYEEGKPNYSTLILDNKFICLDSTTCLSKKVNIIVIEDEDEDEYPCK